MLQGDIVRLQKQVKGKTTEIMELRKALLRREELAITIADPSQSDRLQRLIRNISNDIQCANEEVKVIEDLIECKSQSIADSIDTNGSKSFVEHDSTNFRSNALSPLSSSNESPTVATAGEGKKEQVEEMSDTGT